MRGLANTSWQVDAIKNVNAAFAQVVYPGDDAIVESTTFRDLEREAIAASLKGKDWRGLTYIRLKKIYRGDASAILWFLSLSGFHFYFPAFLLITSREYDSADLTANCSIRAFCSSGRDLAEWIATRRAVFTRDQLIAIRTVFTVLHSEQDRQFRARHGDDDESLRVVLLGDLDEALEEVSSLINNFN